MDAGKIAELALKSGIKNTDTENVIAFALGFADGARSSDSTETVHLYGASVSANVTPIWGFLVEAGIPFEYHEVDLMSGEHLKEEFLSINPYHSVPAIKHGDFCLHESGAILRYLARAFPTRAANFYGNGDIKSQACIDRALDVRLGEVYSKCAKLLYPLYGFAPKLDEETSAAAKEEIIKSLNLFAQVFLSNSTFVGGETPSIADFSIAGPILHFRTCDSFDFFPEAIKKWATAFDAAAPGYAKVMDGETNGRGFGANQYGHMRKSTYEATEVGKVNGASA